MAQMTDFEELVSRIKNPLIKDYMKEAMSCYFAGAYRGCIVMSYISLFDDLTEKLGAIRDVNSDAKAIFIEVEKRKKTQDVFENYLLEQLASKVLISELDRSTINLIRERRNKSAHPSGHHPAAEEARYIFFEVIDKFLSKERLDTKHAVDEIILRFSNQNFFLSSMIRDTEKVVAHEIKLLHKDVYPYLVIKVFSSFKDNEGIINKNASFFLDGLACIDDEDINTNLVKNILEKGLDSDVLKGNCLSLISSNPNLLKKLDGIHKERFESILTQELDSMVFGEVSTKITHPSIILKRALDKLGFDYINEHYPEFLQAIVDKLPFRPGVMDFAIKDDSLKERLISKINENAGSTDFDTANTFINRFFDIEEKASEMLSNSECLELVCSIIKASSNGAWRSNQVVENKFSDFVNIKTKVLTFLNDCNAEALEVIQDKIGGSITCESFKSRYLVKTAQVQKVVELEADEA
jgi:hypothetical protein